MLCMGLLVIGVKETVRVGVLFTALEVIGLIIVIVVSIRFLGSVDYLETPSGLGGIFQATTLLFFAYLGFEQIANLSEESKNPSKHIPLAIIFSVIISTVLYVAVALASVSVVGWQALSESGAPLAQVVQAATGARAGQIVAIIALFATANTTLFLLLTASRMMYGMSGSAVLPTIFSALHPKRRTPWVATLVAGGIAVAFTMIGDIGVVAQLTNFAILVAFVMVNASLIWLRRTRPEVERRFRVPLSIGWIPVPPLLGIGVSLFMIANIEPMGLIIGAIIALAGLPVLFLSRRFGRAGAVAVQAEQD
jgi:APA family basic amino acid/polyamine antiporter